MVWRNQRERNVREPHLLQPPAEMVLWPENQLVVSDPSPRLMATLAFAKDNRGELHLEKSA